MREPPPGPPAGGGAGAGVSRRRFLAMAGATLAAGVTAACGKGSGSDDALRIGVIAPFSGPGESIGGVVDSALDAAARQINRTGGVRGRKVRLLLRDTTGDPALSLRVYRDLVDTPGLVGMLWCGAPGFEEALPFIRRDGVPLVTVFQDPFSVGRLYPAENGAGRSVFQVSVPDVYVKQALARYARNDRGYTSAGMLFDRDVDRELGVPGASKEHFTRAFGDAGLTVAGTEEYASDDQDFGPQLSSLQGSAPQLLYLDGLADGTAAITQALAGMGADYVDTPAARGSAWRPHLFGSFRAVNRLWAELAEESAKVGSVTAWHLGGVPYLPTYTMGKWLRQYLGKDPVGGEELAADGLATLLKGLEKAGTTDRQRVVQGIETMGRIRFASLDLEFAKTRHSAIGQDDIVLLTLERLRGPAPTTPSYVLGAEWRESGLFSAVGADVSWLVRPTLTANRAARPDAVAQALKAGYGTQCTRHVDGGLGPECKIH